MAAMDTVGVDGAICLSAFSMSRYDASYAVEVQRAHPGRFALVTPVDPDHPAVAEVSADWTRAFAVVNYAQAVEPFRLTDRLRDSERAMLMGGACAKAYGWSPKNGEVFGSVIHVMLEISSGCNGMYGLAL